MRRRAPLHRRRKLASQPRFLYLRSRETFEPDQAAKIRPRRTFKKQAQGPRHAADLHRLHDAFCIEVEECKGEMAVSGDQKDLAPDFKEVCKQVRRDNPVARRSGQSYPSALKVFEPQNL